jgi:peptide/nickel transport system substrate-binding protein
MKKKLLFVFVIVALILAGCGGGRSTAQPKSNATTAPTKGSGEPSVVRIGWTNGPDSLNPGVAWLVEAYTIYELIYDSMYELNLDGTFSLGVAEDAQRSDDGLVYTFKIKQGIKWHDGKPFTAKDIAFTYNFYLTHEDFATINSYTEHFVSIEAPDDKTVVIKLDQPVPNMESKLVFQYILPEHIWKDHSDDKAAEFENLEMIGSGPFKMKEYVANEFIRLEANKEYFGGAPKVNEVVFQVFANPDVMLQAIKTGQIDMASEISNTGIAALKNVENVKVVTGSPLSPDLTDIIFNQVLPENCPSAADGGICSGHPALRDKQVRLAMAYATDKQKLIDIVVVGIGTPGIALIPDGLGEWFNSDIKDFPYDVAQAKKLLDDAGYKDKDGDGIRDMPDGSRPLTFRLNWTSSSIVGPRLAELLSEMWKEIGISLELQAVEDDALTAKCCPALDYDIMIWGWVADPDPMTLLIIPTTDQIVTGYNETGYSNPRYDELFAKQGVELDHAKRVAMVWEMQKIVHDDVVYIIPFYNLTVQAYRTDRFKGWLDSKTKLALQDVSSLMVIEPVK